MSGYVTTHMTFRRLSRHRRNHSSSPSGPTYGTLYDTVTFSLSGLEQGHRSGTATDALRRSTEAVTYPIEQGFVGLQEPLNLTLSVLGLQSYYCGVVELFGHGR